MPLVSEETGSLFVKWRQVTVILGTDIIEVLRTEGGSTAGRYIAIFFAGIGFGRGLEVFFLGLFHISLLLSLDGVGCEEAGWGCSLWPSEASVYRPWRG